MYTNQNREPVTAQPLRHLWLEITGRCNLECGHCYSDSGPDAELTGRMALADWYKLIDDAKAQGCQQVQIIGGEPLVHPDFAAILEHAAKSMPTVEVFTNATMLTRERIALLKRAGASVATSIYADNATTHDAVTQRRGSFARTTSNIVAAIEAGLSVRASVIITKANSDQDVERTISYLKGIGIHSIGIDDARAVGRGAVNDNNQDPVAALCGHCFDGSICATFDGKSHPCIMSRTIDLGDVRQGLSNVLDARDSAAEVIRPRFQTRSDDCLPRTCSPNGEKCLPNTCTPQCGPVWRP